MENFYIDEIDKNWNDFYQKLKKEDYLLLEKIIIDNNIDILNYILIKLRKIKDKEYLKIFTPGFFRNEKILKRQLPCYLYLIAMNETKEILLTHYETRNYLLKYWNDNICL